MVNLFVYSTLRPFNDPFAFIGGGDVVRWYSILFIIGIFMGILIACVRLQTYYKLKYDLIFYFAIILIPVSLIGARFWSACIGDLDWANFFNFKSGGLAIQGGVIFCIIAGCIYFPLMLRKPKYHVRVEEGENVYIRQPSFWIIFDAIMPVILIGQAVGRWGNFFNGEIFGSAATTQQLAWLNNLMPGVYTHMISQAPLNDPNWATVHGQLYQPLFLYESLINTICFSVIYFVLPTIKEIRIGVIGSLYLITYGITRSIMEPLRFGDYSSGYKFVGTYVLNSICLFAGIVLFIICQFVLVRFRTRRCWFQLYCLYLRRFFLKMFKKTKFEWVLKAYQEDPTLNNYGYAKVPSFIRTTEQMYYYANK